MTHPSIASVSVEKVFKGAIYWKINPNLHSLIREVDISHQYDFLLGFQIEKCTFEGEKTFEGEWLNSNFV